MGPGLALRALAEKTDGTLPAVTASIGVVALAAGDSLTLGLQRAAEAAYAAKSRGRNRIERATGLALAA